MSSGCSASGNEGSRNSVRPGDARSPNRKEEGREVMGAVKHLVGEVYAAVQSADCRKRKEGFND